MKRKRRRSQEEKFVLVKDDNVPFPPRRTFRGGERKQVDFQERDEEHLHGTNVEMKLKDVDVDAGDEGKEKATRSFLDHQFIIK